MKVFNFQNDQAGKRIERLKPTDKSVGVKRKGTVWVLLNVTRRWCGKGTPGHGSD